MPPSVCFGSVSSNIREALENQEQTHIRQDFGKWTKVRVSETVEK